MSKIIWTSSKYFGTDPNIFGPIRGQGKSKLLFQKAAKNRNKAMDLKFPQYSKLFRQVQSFLDLTPVYFGPIEGQGKSKMLFQGAAKNRNKSHASKVSAIFKLLKWSRQQKSFWTKGGRVLGTITKKLAYVNQPEGIVQLQDCLS